MDRESLIDLLFTSLPTFAYNVNAEKRLVT